MFSTSDTRFKVKKEDLEKIKVSIDGEGKLVVQPYALIKIAGVSAYIKSTRLFIENLELSDAEKKLYHRYLLNDSIAPCPKVDLTIYGIEPNPGPTDDSDSESLLRTLSVMSMHDTLAWCAAAIGTSIP